MVVLPLGTATADSPDTTELMVTPNTGGALFGASGGGSWFGGGGVSGGTGSLLGTRCATTRGRGGSGGGGSGGGGGGSGRTSGGGGGGSRISISTVRSRSESRASAFHTATATAEWMVSAAPSAIAEVEALFLPPPIHLRHFPPGGLPEGGVGDGAGAVDGAAAAAAGRSTLMANRRTPARLTRSMTCTTSPCATTRSAAMMACRSGFLGSVSPMYLTSAVSLVR